MGLGIVAGSQAVFVTSDLDSESMSERDIYVLVSEYPERLDGKPEGIYRITGDILSFSIGAFSKYHAWRQLLTELVYRVSPETIWDNYQAYKSQPFVELICFSDNEGAIGPVTSEKLAKDFADYLVEVENWIAKATEQLVADPPPQVEIGYIDFLEIYKRFQEAFQLASDDGFVIFS